MQIQINGNKNIVFTPKGIAYVLDLLSNQPFKEVNGLIGDILGQLKEQEVATSGSSESS